MNTVRSSINEPHFLRGGEFMQQITEDSFQRSSLVGTVHRVLGVIDEWRNSLGPNHAFLNYPNRLDVRFSCLHPGGWGLRINEHFFFDIYPMAKRDRHEVRCRNAELPLVEITASDDFDAYKIYCDHFRYLWDHDVTIDYRDAIHLDEMTRNLRLLPPQEVTFDHTARRVLGFGGKADDDEAVFAYKRKAATILKRFCPAFLPWREKEVVFIACSWKGKTPHPISEADALRRLLERDFQPAQSPDTFASPKIEIRMVFTSPGNELQSTINRALNEATIGVVFLSPELTCAQPRGSELYLARPNVYFELGHLMAQLSSERIVLFVESSMQPPSNLANLAYVKYELGKIQLKYLELLVTFFEINLFSSRTSFEEIVRRHMQQLAREVAKGIIELDDYKWAQEYLASKEDIRIE